MKLVVVTPAGRRRYLEILAQYLLPDPDVDRWDLWVNTDNQDDICWMEELADKHSKVRIVTDSIPFFQPSNFRIHNFFKRATDPDTVYIRLDDDIVYVAPGTLKTIAAARVADPHPFLMYGNVLNSGLSSHLQQRAGRLSKQFGFAGYNCIDDIGWRNPEFVIDLHSRFLANPDPKQWHLTDWDLHGYERHSINCISWLGSDAAKWVPTMDSDEEVWLSCAAPTQFKRPCKIIGNTLVVHYSFFITRDRVDGEPWILDGYRKLAGL